MTTEQMRGSGLESEQFQPVLAVRESLISEASKRQKIINDLQEARGISRARKYNIPASVRRLVLICPKCSKEFSKSLGDVNKALRKGNSFMYCGVACAGLQASEGKSPSRVCPSCGGKKAGHALNCIHCLRKEAREARTALHCTQCEKEFTRNPGEMEKANRRGDNIKHRFCSQACFTRYRKEHTTEKKKNKCRQCGAPAKKDFCTHPCYLQYRKERRKSEKYAGSFLASKTAIAQRQGEACAMCTQKFTRMQIHHVDHAPENQSHENLVLLCMPCHRAYHRLQGAAQKALKRIFQEKARM